MYQESLLSYRNFRYLKLSLLILLGAIAAYFLDPVMGPHNGGTWVGYGLGVVATLLLVWLMWLGIRKRHYASRLGSVQGWVSAHVYLGLTLIFIVTLHAGFQFGVNVHTLAYGLLLMVILSGLYGVFAYLHYPRKMSTNSSGMTDTQMLQEISELDQECLSLAKELPVHQVLLHAIENTKFKGRVWRLFRNQHKYSVSAVRKPAVLEEYEAYDDTMFTIADQMTHAKQENAEPLRRILELLGRRSALCKRLQISLHYQAVLKAWQYFHIPLSSALLAAVIVHIITVFLYW